MIEKMVAEYATGVTAAVLAKRYDVAKSTVLRHVREAGAPVRYPRFSETDRVLAIELSCTDRDWHRLRSLCSLTAAKAPFGTYFNGRG